jgi:N-acetylneuraminic acid mutarotase
MESASSLASILGGSASASRRAATTLLNQLIRAGLLLLLACLCLSARAQQNEWTWMGGSSTVGSNGGQPGVYGTKGTPAARNVPGGRYYASSWTDSSGHLWLFGGAGYNYSYLNDLWEFTPSTNQWTWMGGSSTVGSNCDQYGDCGRPGVYGTLGTPAVGNIPGGRDGASSWTDSSGHLWLFGGVGFDANGNGVYLNDLWEFNSSTNEWAWMGGSSTIPACSSGHCGQSGVYGTLETPAAGNVPGGRYLATSWTDKSGHLWLFGGYGKDASGKFGELNDLWEFNPSTKEWAWMGGSSTAWQFGVYGTLGTPAVGTVPGGRESASSWTDSSGNLWLFGGFGLDANNQNDDLNDLWEFNPSTKEWAWMGGSSTVVSYGGQPGVYGTLGTPAAGDVPGGRNSASSWTDSSGHLWLFGGVGYDAGGNAGKLNDLWEFNPSLGTYGEWAWMGGSSTVGSNSGQPGVYGTLGTSAAGNIPGGRYSASFWIDKNGNFWLFGGKGFDGNGISGLLNDLWKYQPSTPAAATPTFSPAGGTYSSAPTITISDATQNATIYYTTDGKTTPTTSSAKYTTTIKVSSSETIQAIAVSAGYTTSAVASATYKLQAAPPSFSPAVGTYTTVQTVTLADVTPKAVIYYTTDGKTTPTANSTKYTGAGIKVSQTTTIKAIAMATGYANSIVATGTYTLHSPQTITFKQPTSPVTYGVKPITLSATASSGLAVTFSVVSGPAKVSGTTLTITGAGSVVVAANQAGNANYTAAAQVTRSITVNKAKLTVTANNLSMKKGATVPTLTYTMAGFVNNDTQKTATTGQPALSTTATSKSTPGSYPVTVKAGTLATANYSFTLVNGTLTVTK